MTLVDPKGGVSYGFGEKLPSSHVNTVWAQQPNAVDGVNGGTYTGLVDLDNLEGRVRTGKQLTVDDGGDVQWIDAANKENLPRITQRVYSYAVPMSFAFGSGVDWAFSTPQFGVTRTNAHFQWLQTDVASPLDALVVPIPYPAYETGLTFRGLTVWLLGAAGGGGHTGTFGAKGSGLQIEKPQLRIIAKRHGQGSAIGGTLDELDIVNDPETTIGAYEARHIIDTDTHGNGPYNDAPVVSGAATSYYAYIYGEDGVNAQANECAVFGMVSHWNITRIGP